MQRILNSLSFVNSTEYFKTEYPLRILYLKKISNILNELFKIRDESYDHFMNMNILLFNLVVESTAFNLH